VSKKKSPRGSTMMQWALPYEKKVQKEARIRRKQLLWVEYGLITRPTPYVEYVPPTPEIPLMKGKPKHAMDRLIAFLQNPSC